MEGQGGAEKIADRAQIGGPVVNGIHSTRESETWRGPHVDEVPANRVARDVETVLAWPVEPSHEGEGDHDADDREGSSRKTITGIGSDLFGGSEKGRRHQADLT
ncbi:hypothetical protein GCM10007036_23170 [Alsobacter metallidurans]|uniref:Uncharacterized protein n=1 Tax=Alsobacter metallidurans TaxID=340221 RepID=A0A917MJU9_9HYPH|nr:hypothetical protein GCM10007036_23170 [Alsobacter metallidurans]